MTTQFTTKLRLSTPDTGSYDWEYFWLGNMKIIDGNVPRVFMNAPYISSIASDAAAGSLTPGHYYYYKVIAWDSSATFITCSSAEPVYAFMDPGPGYTENLVNWSAVAGASKYSLYRADVATLTVPPADASYFWIAEIGSPATFHLDSGDVAGAVMPTVATWLVTEIDQKCIMPDSSEAATFDTLSGSSTLINNLNRARAVLALHGGSTNWYDTPPTNLYQIVNGRAGGQTFRGGTLASQNLTLDSTAHVTKGNIVLNPSGGYVGIANASPSFRLDIGAGAATEGMRIYAGGSGNATLLCQSPVGGYVDFSIASAGFYGRIEALVSGPILNFYLNNFTTYPYLQITTATSTFKTNVFLGLAGTYLKFAGSTANTTSISANTVSSATATFNVDSPLTTIAGGNGCVWHYSIAYGDNRRTGTVHAVWDSSGNIKYTEMATDDVGDTSGLTFSVILTTGSIALKATNAGGTWDVRTVRIIL
jgi:hypothetical protein